MTGDGLIQHRELQHVMRACMEENGMQFSEDQVSVLHFSPAVVEIEFLVDRNLMTANCFGLFKCLTKSYEAYSKCILE